MNNYNINLTNFIAQNFNGYRKLKGNLTMRLFCTELIDLRSGLKDDLSPVYLTINLDALGVYTGMASAASYRFNLDDPSDIECIDNVLGMIYGHNSNNVLSLSKTRAIELLQHGIEAKTDECGNVSSTNNILTPNGIVSVYTQRREGWSVQRAATRCAYICWQDFR